MGWLGVLAGSSMIFWVVLALANMKFKFGDRLGLGKILSAKWQLWGILLVGAVLTGFGTDMLSNLGVASVSDESAPAVSGDLIGTLTVSMYANADVNGSESSADYRNDAEDMITLYLTDSATTDNEYIIFNASIERTAISEDATLDLTCVALDKELSGTTEKSLVSYSAGEIEMDISVAGGSYSASVTDDTARKQVAFAEGTGSRDVAIRFKTDENYHDGMTDMQDYYDVTCSIGGKNFVFRTLANS